MASLRTAIRLLIGLAIVFATAPVAAQDDGFWRLTYAVDRDAFIVDSLVDFSRSIAEALNQSPAIAYDSLSSPSEIADDRRISLQLADGADTGEAERRLRGLLLTSIGGASFTFDLVTIGGGRFRFFLPDTLLDQSLDELLPLTAKTIQQRLTLHAPDGTVVVPREERIDIDVPAAAYSPDLASLLVQPGHVSFHIVEDMIPAAEAPTRVAAGATVVADIDDPSRAYVVGPEQLDGYDAASIAVDASERPHLIGFSFGSAEAERLRALMETAFGATLIVSLDGLAVAVAEITDIVEDGEIWFVAHGLSEHPADDLAMLLRSQPIALPLVQVGALSVPVQAAMPDAGVVPTEELQLFGGFAIDPAAPGLIIFNGAIDQTSARDFHAAMSANPQATVLVLNSIGGFVDPALLIADEVAARRMDTYVPAGSGCDSACAFIFIAGNRRLADGALGVHQFTSETSDTATDLLLVADIMDLIERSGVDVEMLEIMLRTPPSTMYTFSNREKVELGIHVGTIAVPADYGIPNDLIRQAVYAELVELAHDPSDLHAFAKDFLGPLDAFSLSITEDILANLFLHPRFENYLEEAVANGEVALGTTEAVGVAAYSRLITDGLFRLTPTDRETFFAATAVIVRQLSDNDPANCVDNILGQPNGLALMEAVASIKAAREPIAAFFDVFERAIEAELDALRAPTYLSSRRLSEALEAYALEVERALDNASDEAWLVADHPELAATYPAAACEMLIVSLEALAHTSLDIRDDVHLALLQIMFP